MHGPQVFKGYWNDAQKTADAFVEIEGKQFFRSGDLGYIDEEGFFFFTDRLKRMINASGFKVWPAEVEAMMYQNKEIQECCIIASQDPYRGETVKAVIVKKPGSEITQQSVIDWAHEHMAAYKTPRVVEFVDMLPKSATGKVMWRALQGKGAGGKVKWRSLLRVYLRTHFRMKCLMHFQQEEQWQGARRVS